MIEIWGRTNSANVQPVVWTCEELGLTYRRHDAGGKFGGLGSPEYLAMNPNGLIPALRDGEVTVFESAAIVRYLAARYGSDAFWPADAAARAALDQWAEWARGSLHAAMTALFMQHVRTPAAKRDPARITAAEADLAKHLGILDARIGAGPWLGGQALSWADILMATPLFRIMQMPVARPAVPNVEAWYARLAERPAYVRHVMVPYTELQVA